MLKGSLTVFVGTLVAQGIGFVFLPFLTRAYAPTEFGEYQLYMSVLMLVIVTASWRYEVALLSAAQGLEERSVLHLCLGFNAVTAVFAYALASLFFAFGPASLTAGIAHVSPALLASGVLAGGVLQTFTYVVLREQALALNAIAKIVQVAAFSALSLLAAHFFAASAGLVASDVASRFVGGGLIALWALRSRSGYFQRPAMASIRTVTVKFRAYAFLTVPGGLLSGAMASAVPLFMWTAFGAGTMGQYALVERSVLMPAALLGQSVAQAFTANFSAAVLKGAFDIRDFRQVVLVMSALGAGPAIVLFFFGEPVFTLVFGQQWREAGRMAEIVGLLLVPTLAVTPVNMTLLVLGRQRVQLTWELLRMVAVIALWSALVGSGAPPHVAIAWHAALLFSMSIAFLSLADRALRPLRNADNRGASGRIFRQDAVDHDCGIDDVSRGDHEV